MRDACKHSRRVCSKNPPEQLSMLYGYYEVSDEENGNEI